jgi:steroid delta-isomerase-like uncharacterized protein
MAAHDQATLARRIYQLFSDGQLDEVVELVAEDVETVVIPFGQTFHGRDGFMAFMRGFKDAFPDIRINVTNQVAADDYVVNEFTATGTHTGPLQTPAGPIPPTGRPVTLMVCEIWKTRDGQITSLRNYQDAASLMRQLGVSA